MKSPHGRQRCLVSLLALLWLAPVWAKTPAQTADPSVVPARLPQLALEALGNADFGRFADLQVQRVQADPTDPTPLAHLAVFLDRLPDPDQQILKLDELAALPLPPPSRRLLDQLRLDLNLRLGRNQETQRLAEFQGTFQRFLRISFPRPPFELDVASALPHQGAREDIDLLEPLGVLIHPDRWRAEATNALLWGGFELAQPEDAVLILQTSSPARLFLDGVEVLRVDPASGSFATWNQATASLGSGWHRILLMTQRGEPPWSVRLLLQSPDATPLALNPVEDLKALTQETFAQTFPAWDLPVVQPVAVGKDVFKELDLAALDLALGRLPQAEDRLSVLAQQPEPRFRPFVDLYRVLNHQRSALLEHSRMRHRKEEADLLRGAANRQDAPVLLRLLAAARLIADGERERSALLLQSVDPDSCPALALRAEWLAQHGLPEDHLAALRKANSCNPFDRRSGQALARLLLERGQREEALKVGMLTLEANAQESGFRRWLALELGAAGRLTEALALCRSQRPGDGPSSEVLCEGLVLLRSGEREQAKETLTTAHRRSPADVETALALATALDLAGDPAEGRTKRQEAQVRQGTGRGHMPGLIAALDTSVEVLIQAAEKPPVPAAPQRAEARGLTAVAPIPTSLLKDAAGLTHGASSIQLLDINLLDIEADGRFREYYHGAAQALDATARETAGELQIPGDARLLHARVHLPDGRTLLPEQIQNDGRTQVVSFFGLVDGAVTDFSWERPAQPLERIATSFIFSGFQSPLLISRLCLAGDVTGLPLDLKVRNAAPLTEGNGMVGGHKVRCWERRLIPPAPAEPSMPDVITLEPAITAAYHFPESTLQATLLRRLSLASRTEARLQRALAELLPKIGPRPEAIHHWITENIREGDEAESPLDALVLGRGTAEQRIGLAKILCDQAGIPASMVVVFEGARPRLTETVSRLGSLALEVRPAGQPHPWYWTFHSPYLGPAALDPALVEARMLALRGAALEALPVLPSSLERDGWSFEAEVDLQPDGSALIQGTLQASGVAAAAFREVLQQAGSESALLRGLTSSVFPGMDLTQGSIEGKSPASLVLLGRFQGHWPKMLGTGDRAVLRPIPISPGLAELVSATARRYPLVLEEFLMGDRIRIVYRLPPGLEFGKPPRSFLDKGDFGTYTLGFQQSLQELTVQRSAVIPPQKIEASSYAAFRKLCLAIEDAEAQTVEVLKKPRESDSDESPSRASH